MTDKNIEKLNEAELLMIPYREVLYAQARDYEYQGKYQLAIEKYQEIVALGSAEGIREIAKICIVYIRLSEVSKIPVSVNFNRLLLWLKKICNLYPEEVFSVIYLFLILDILKHNECTQYKNFLERSTNQHALKYQKLLLKGESCAKTLSKL